MARLINRNEVGSRITTHEIATRFGIDHDYVVNTMLAIQYTMQAQIDYPPTKSIGMDTICPDNYAVGKHLGEMLVSYFEDSDF